jgi:hypothetical protein
LADAAFDRVHHTLTTLTASRPVEAALVRAQLLAALCNGDEAVGVLSRLVNDAPPGFAAWTVPAEPLLRELTAVKGFAAVLARLADRAR